MYIQTLAFFKIKSGINNHIRQSGVNLQTIVITFVGTLHSF